MDKILEPLKKQIDTLSDEKNFGRIVKWTCNSETLLEGRSVGR